MSKVMIAPGRYVQGAGAIVEIGDHLKGRGTKALVLGGHKGLGSVRDSMEASLDRAGIAARFEPFGGECTGQKSNDLSRWSERAAATS